MPYSGICLHYHGVKNVRCDLETDTSLVATVVVFVVARLSHLKEMTTHVCPPRTVLLTKTEAWLKIVMTSFVAH